MKVILWYKISSKKSFLVACYNAGRVYLDFTVRLRNSNFSIYQLDDLEKII